MRISVGERTIVVSDPGLLALHTRIRTRLGPADFPVLIQGETGTGKELVALALHAYSQRSSGPFVTLNSAALPETLVENELFGHTKGAFSGADADRPGLIEAAHGGVLLLDEIGDLPLSAQVKLLRVVETRHVRRLGETQERQIDVRFLASTHRDLTAEVRAGRFRRDLYYRLRGATVALPRLGAQPQDVPGLATELLALRAEARAGILGHESAPVRLSADAAQVLIEHSWAGNMRELCAFVDYAVTAGEPVIGAAAVREWVSQERVQGRASLERVSIAPVTTPLSPQFRPIADEIAALERKRMQAALEATGGCRAKAAALISMPLRTFTTKLRLYDLGRTSQESP
ncbi:MAG: sigma-54-dependent Fis family transcriptional regulator [Deltaproteobacteria bacterium]|nr:sigma-54-dependent Fis family transcriptional regulator [Deltaproteobacteria bacterium]